MAALCFCPSQELERGEMLDDVTQFLLAMGLELEFWQHPGRVDGIGIAFRFGPRKGTNSETLSIAGPGSVRDVIRGPVVTGILELTHVSSELRIRVLSSHLRGKDSAQMEDLITASLTRIAPPEDGGDKLPPGIPTGKEFVPAPADVIVIGGDFNEDFHGECSGDDAKDDGSSAADRLCRLQKSAPARAGFVTYSRTDDEPQASAMDL